MTGTRREIRRSPRARASPRPGAAIAIRWMIALVDPPSAMSVTTPLSNASAREHGATGGDPPTPSPRRAGRRPSPSGRAPSARPESTPRPAASAPAPRRSTPSSTRCPSSCTCPAIGRCRPRPARSAHSSRLPALRSAQYFHTSVPLPRRRSAQAPLQHRPGGHEDRGQVHRDRAHEQAGHGLVAPAHQHHAVDRVASAGSPRPPSPAGCDRTSPSAS